MRWVDSVRRLAGASKLKKHAGTRVAVVHWDRENIHYFVATPGSPRVREQDVGSIATNIADNPFIALANHFSEHEIHATRLVALLSRPELDLFSLNLPPAESAEIASLVASEVEQQIGESLEPPIIDYCFAQSGKTGSDTSESPTIGNQVLAFALSRKELESIRSQCEGAGFRLQAIGSRHLAPLSLLKEQGLRSDFLMVAIHLYPGETELTFCLKGEPLLLRSIRNSTDDPDRVAEQIALESQRCFTLLPQNVGELSKEWFLFATGESATNVASALQSREAISVTTLDPLASWKQEPSSDGVRALTANVSAANVGAATDFIRQSLPIDLLHPKRPPVPQSPLRRWGGLGLLAAAASSLGGYLLLSDVWQLQAEADDLANELQNTAKLTAKYMEKSDQVQAVETWLADQVDWLAEFSELASRLPDGSSASIRRLSASANGTGASIDISVEVNSQETISELENRIRGAKYSILSKQINQNIDSQEYPWRFESQISFAIDPPSRKQFGPPASVDDSERETSAPDETAVSNVPGRSGESPEEEGQ
jgi:hypothetical protein